MGQDVATKRLYKYFTPAFRRGLELEQALSSGQETRAHVDVIGELERLLATASKNATADGHHSAGVNDAQFALVSWLDEVLGQSRFKRWREASALGSPSRSLQETLYNTNKAGHEFFSRLDGLGVEESEIREVYFIALVLGFVGQYFYELDGNGILDPEGDLSHRIRTESNRLPSKPMIMANLHQEKILPDMYAAGDPDGPHIPRSPGTWLLRSVIVFCLVLPVVYLAWVLIGGERGPSSTEQISALVSAQNKQCSDITSHETSAGVVQLEGYVPKADDAARLKSQIEALPGVRQVVGELKIRIWPYCEVLEILKPFTARNVGGKYGLSIDVRTQNREEFIEGNAVVFDAHSPNYNSHVYVDYYVIDGTVIHVFPDRASSRANPLESNSTASFGDEIEAPFVIAPPFGQELVTVIAAPRALEIGAPRPDSEPAAEYLKALKAALGSQGEHSQVIADKKFLQTKAR